MVYNELIETTKQRPAKNPQEIKDREDNIEKIRQVGHCAVVFGGGGSIPTLVFHVAQGKRIVGLGIWGGIGLWGRGGGQDSVNVTGRISLQVNVDVHADSV